MSTAAPWPGIETIDTGLRGPCVWASVAPGNGKDVPLNQLDDRVSLPEMPMMVGLAEIGEGVRIALRPERQARA